ncbi:24032_t:CDS:1, partial [Gigaspora margarita]
MEYMEQENVSNYEKNVDDEFFTRWSKRRSNLSETTPRKKLKNNSTK